MTDLDALVRNIVGMPQAPVAPAWKLDAANRRIAILETAIVDFLKDMADAEYVGPISKQLDELAETVGFDRDEYGRGE